MPGIVADGFGRARQAVTIAVKAEVAAENQERLQTADDQQRAKLRRGMDQEIRRRIHEKSPPHGLY